jgi:hypothetical protein
MGVLVVHSLAEIVRHMNQLNRFALGVFPVDAAVIAGGCSPVGRGSEHAVKAGAAPREAGRRQVHDGQRLAHRPVESAEL